MDCNTIEMAIFFYIFEFNLINNNIYIPFAAVGNISNKINFFTIYCLIVVFI